MIVDMSEILTKFGLASDATTAQLGLLNMIHPEVEQAIKDICGCQLETGTYTHFLPAKEQFTPRDAFMDQFDVVGQRAVSGYGRQTTADILQLPEIPVRSITSIYEDRLGFAGEYPGSFASGTLLVEGTNFWVDFESPGFCRTGQVRRMAGCWPGSPRSVKVTYTAGYTADELNGKPTQPDQNALPIKEAVLLGIAASYNATLAIQDGADGPITETRLGDKLQRIDYFSTESGFKVVIPGAARRRLKRYINYGRILGG